LSVPDSILPSSAGEEPPIAALRGVSKTYDGVRVLGDVDLEFAAGEVSCLMGENGSGKSTLIKILTGVIAPDPGGLIEIRGRAFSRVTPAAALDSGIAVIHQDLSLFGPLSVVDNITLRDLAAAPWGGARKAVRRRSALQALERLGVDLDPDAGVEELPIAKRQLTAIARAVVHDARLIIMDEPTASLPSREVGRLLDVIETLRDQGVAILFVSHRLDEVTRIADRVSVLRDGNLIGRWPGRGLTRAVLTEAMTGRPPVDEAPSSPRRSDRVILETRGLSRAGEFQDVSLSVASGEIVGLGGLLGAGRTELALSLFGVAEPDSGEILLENRQVSFRSIRDAVAQGVAYVSEDRARLGLVLDQPISANLLLGATDRVSSRWGVIDLRSFKAEAARWIAALGIKTNDPERAVSTLSGGNQQRVSIGKWPARNPRLIILDSPTVGVDVGAREGIYDIIRRSAEEGAAVVVISDEVEELRRLASRVLVMRGGVIVSEHRPAEEPASALEAAIHD